jgi:hypothetical protein
MALLPREHLLSRAGNLLARKPLHGCKQLYLPPKLGQLGLLNVTQLNIDQPDGLHSTGLMARGWRIYASTENLYLAAAPAAQKTVLHKFMLRGEENRPEYVAAGQVPGYLLNQFSMSEHEGHLRVATTDHRNRDNSLFVLREAGSQLRIVGQVRGLGRGERIYAARMFGDKGYIVTFRRTDPLYTLDLSRPTAPKMVGELKVNGFSSYIHPLGPDHLLTIGQDADNRGRVLGMHLQIFDLSDFATPKRTHHYRYKHGAGRVQSAAQNNHHAFTYDPRTKSLAIPLAYNNHRSRDAFNGLLLLKVGAQQGFEQLGKISHAELYLAKLMVGCKQARGCSHFRGQSYRHTARMAAPIQRSIIMDRYIYSLSGVGLAIHKLERADDPVAEILL